jgi:putative endonuclease
MAKHNIIGIQGEAMAATYFLENNYQILHKNWRYSKYEVDIIATKNNTLHFIEVKTRKQNKNGYPEEAVTKAKMTFLQNAAEAFLYQYPNWQRIQFDVLAITLLPQPQYFLLEDVFI